MKHRTVSATEFKAKCLALLDEVEESGGTITVTKRGKPVAEVRPAVEKPWDAMRDRWKGKVEIVGDIVNLDTSHLWNVVSEEAGE
jgi:prevent-host-death family protein